MMFRSSTRSPIHRRLGLAVMMLCSVLGLACTEALEDVPQRMTAATDAGSSSMNSDADGSGDGAANDAASGELGGGDGSNTGSNTGSDTGDAADSGAVPVSADPETCANQTVNAMPVTPRVVLVVDQSGSMAEGFDDRTDSGSGAAGNRWDVLKNFLLEPNGLIEGLQGSVQFGLAMYSAIPREDDPAVPEGECPRLTTVAPMLDNYDAIRATYDPAQPSRDTPTGDAIEAIVDTLGLAATGPDTDAEPTVLILATDGEPDSCAALSPQTGQQRAIDAVTDAYNAGIQTFVISVGNDVSEAHQQDIANAGVGRPLTTDDPAEYWRAGDGDALAAAIAQIVNRQLTCEVALEGAIDSDDICRGTVTLESRELACDDPNGWTAVDERTIQLQGTACDALLNEGGVLSAQFPCDVQILL